MAHPDNGHRDRFIAHSARMRHARDTVPTWHSPDVHRRIVVYIQCSGRRTEVAIYCECRAFCFLRTVGTSREKERLKAMPGPTPLPSYKSPPVIEFVAGVVFKVLQDWQTRYYGQLWAEISGEFPKTEDHPPLLDPGGIEFEVMKTPPLRRVFFVSQTENYVIQVQPNRFHYNWRRVRDVDVYPRFEQVFTRFQKSWETFLEFIRRRGLPDVVPQRYELTYVNHIPISGEDFASSLEEYVKMFNWGSVNAEFLPKPKSLSWKCGFETSPKGSLVANLAHGKLAAGKDVLVLNLTASGPPDSPLNAWFQTAREWIVRGFTDLTTEDAHKKWGRER